MPVAFFRQDLPRLWWACFILLIPSKIFVYPYADYSPPNAKECVWGPHKTGSLLGQKGLKKA